MRPGGLGRMRCSYSVQHHRGYQCHRYFAHRQVKVSLSAMTSSRVRAAGHLQPSAAIESTTWSTNVSLDTAGQVQFSHVTSQWQDITNFNLCRSQTTRLNESQVECPEAGLPTHIFEAGRELDRRPPLIILLHGFPELAYSWRKVMPLLANAGYHVVAPNLRGYGRTTGWDTSSYEHVDMSNFTLTGLARDVVVLVHAL